ncbi:MAG: hypothetical protein Q7K47_04020 [Fusobacterium sp. JB019]|nr:hypothetical protein [Fusobacterium sp. JB019]
MKKLVVFLGALSIVSSAYAKEVMPVAEVAAAPMLKVDSIGQYIEVDNDSGSSNGDIGHMMFAQKVGLSYGDDWTFGLMARKGWDTDTSDGFGDTSSRIDLDVWRNYDNYSLGFRWRQETNSEDSDSDRYYLRGKYHYGDFSGWADFAYQADEESADNFYLEAIPVKYSYNNFAIGYYLEGRDTVGSTSLGEEESWSKHQVRLYAPVYSNDKLALNLEYRYQFYEDKDLDNKDWDDENNAHIVVLSADYQVNDNLSLTSYYEYDFNKYEESDDDYYGEFLIGWNYQF